jgi:hypothetical protein
LQWKRRFSLPTSRPEQAPLSLPGNDPLIQSVADRVRAVVERQPGRSLAALAGMLRVEYDVFRSLITEPERTVEPTFLIDVVAGLVRECAVDPQWLLTGNYDGAIHRHALLLGEDRSPVGACAVLAFVGEHFRALRESNLPVIAAAETTQRLAGEP